MGAAIGLLLGLLLDQLLVGVVGFVVGGAGGVIVVRGEEFVSVPRTPAPARTSSRLRSRRRSWSRPAD